MKFIDFFSRIYILNLPERTDRLQYMKRELARVNMPFDSDNVHLFPAIKPQEKEPFIKLGSKGCFLSTLQMLKESQAAQADNLLILQDDAQFTPNFQKFEDKLVAQLQEKTWDIAQFGYTPLPDDPVAQAFVEAKPEEIGALEPFSGDLIGAHCFAINGQSLERYIEFLEKLLSRPLGHPEGGPMPIDGSFNVFSRRPDGTRLVAVPSLVTQRRSRSDVSPNRYDQIPVLRPVLSLARSVGVTKLFRWK